MCRFAERLANEAETAKRAVEIAIEQSEDAAMGFIAENR